MSLAAPHVAPTSVRKWSPVSFWLWVEIGEEVVHFLSFTPDKEQILRKCIFVRVAPVHVERVLKVGLQELVDFVDDVKRHL